MAYRLQNNDPLEEEFLRVAGEQVRRALHCLDDVASAPESRVHKARQYSKKLRALFRLFRSALEDEGSWKRLDRLAAAAARHLSTQRDAGVALATLDALHRRAEWAVDEAALERLRAKMEKRAAARTDPESLGAAAEKAERRFVELGEVLRSREPGRGFARAQEAGFERTRRAARKWMKRATRSGDAGAFHRWRKHAKYHLYQLRLLHGLSDEDFSSRARQAWRLQRLLGEHHDLALLDDLLARTTPLSGQARAEIRQAIADTMRLRERQALRLGAALFGQS